MMNMKKFSVIIPVYNVEEYVVRCVESVVNQDTSSDFEVILIDDGSTDKSGQLCDELAKKSNKIVVIHQQNAGIGAARNAGIACAKGEFLLFIDSDDFWEPNTISEIESKISPKVDVVRYQYWRVFEDGTKQEGENISIPQGESGKEYLHDLFDQNRFPISFVWLYAWRTSILKDNGIVFDETLSISEDYKFVYDVLPMVRSIVGTSEKLCNYVVRQGSATFSLSAKKLADNLNCKAEVFRRYKNSVVANDFMLQAVRAIDLVGEDYNRIIKIIRNNKDITAYSTGMTLRIANVLISLFGCSAGIKIFGILTKIKRIITK